MVEQNADVRFRLYFHGKFNFFCVCKMLLHCIVYDHYT